MGTANAAYHIMPSLTATVTYSLIKNDYLNGSYARHGRSISRLINEQADKLQDLKITLQTTLLKQPLNFDKTIR